MYNNISEMVGKTVDVITVDKDSNIIEFAFRNGDIYRMLHVQDCCEDVYIDDINGDVESFRGQVILSAVESSNVDYTRDLDGQTWTFYRIACNRDFMVIRWIGTSNGYYSESVDIVKIK